MPLGKLLPWSILMVQPEMCSDVEARFIYMASAGRRRTAWSDRTGGRHGAVVCRKEGNESCQWRCFDCFLDKLLILNAPNRLRESSASFLGRDWRGGSRRLGSRPIAWRRPDIEGTCLACNAGAAFNRLGFDVLADLAAPARHVIELLIDCRETSRHRTK